MLRVATSTAVTAVLWGLPQGIGMAVKWSVCIDLCADTALGVVFSCTIMVVTAGTKEPHGLIASGRDCYNISKMNNRLPLPAGPCSPQPLGLLAIARVRENPD